MRAGIGGGLASARCFGFRAARCFHCAACRPLVRGDRGRDHACPTFPVASSVPVPHSIVGYGDRRRAVQQRRDEPVVVGGCCRGETRLATCSVRGSNSRSSISMTRRSRCAGSQSAAPPRLRPRSQPRAPAHRSHDVRDPSQRLRVGLRFVRRTRCRPRCERRVIGCARARVLDRRMRDIRRVGRCIQRTGTVRVGCRQVVRAFRRGASRLVARGSIRHDPTHRRRRAQRSRSLRRSHRDDLARSPRPRRRRVRRVAHRRPRECAGAARGRHTTPIPRHLRVPTALPTRAECSLRRAQNPSLRSRRARRARRSFDRHATRFAARVRGR